MSKGEKRGSFRAAQDGSVAVEFAILSPIFVMMIIGALVWGQYLWVAHAVQQLANDAARAAIAGLDAGERETLARESLATEVADYANLRPTAATLNVQNRSDRLVVSVSYDTTDMALHVFSGLVPSPPRLVSRQATVRLGGY